MADYSDDISKLLFDLETQKEQTKRDIETSKKKSSEFSGFMEAFGTDGEALSEKWEREEVAEKEYQEQVARERAEQQALLEEERKAEEARIKKERQRQLKAKKNATASEVRCGIPTSNVTRRTEVGVRETGRCIWKLSQCSYW